ncbi:alpha/beta-hydrolase [Crucibulum laeve]|uniref:Carboxylic ester hydrolase n=1 Tax=Crucibulum laeve TaxID=68775 RepID=A0A5C3M425_9AGAR|nr:alpha/beta-hydrolase [Crucibulum laeve]
MVTFTLIVSSILFAVQTQASPVLTPRTLEIPHIDPQKILCQLPILKKFLCPLTGTAALNRQTPIGIANGVLDPDGAYRFIVKYASANRWAPSAVVTAWNLPTGSANPSTMPLACPQPFVDSSAYTEDCLSMILYVPPSLSLTSAAPTLIWVHGGSFILGSGSAPGLDGSKLAIATGSIIAVVQYRLGALGFLSPDGTTNLAVKDLVSAMQFLKKVVPAFGGSASKITLAGQSSGANMIRALLATPSASSLFRSAILQSDPMNFGFLNPTTHQALQSSFNDIVGCSAIDISCRDSLSLDTIIDAEMDIFSNAVSIDPAAGPSQPIRPVRDGSFITSPLDSTAAFPSVSKPILLTTVLQEAGYAIYGNYNTPQTVADFSDTCNDILGPARTQSIFAAPYYSIAPATGTVDTRVQLQNLGTDYLWKCSGWTFARNWAQHGGPAYVGQYVIGASYPGNEIVSYCTQPGVVCHQDDIQIVFGTTSNPTSVQSALTTQMQKRYKAFLANGNPNAAGVPTWTAVAASDVHALQLGGSGEAPIGACDPSFWGQGVQYDYQFYSN